jgi:hypothetical protein
VAALIIYQVPVVQTALMSGVQHEIGQGKSFMAEAGKAYASGNILRAALVTFRINFLLGSLAYITLTSMIIPGLGVPLAGFRALAWGVLLGPSEVALARLMLPHIGTLFLEGAGYILATFFALMIPIYLFGWSGPVAKPVARVEPALSSDAVDVSLERSSPEQQPDALRRFGRAVLMNLKGNLLVAIVLAVAACYEAVEVIWMAGF